MSAVLFGSIGALADTSELQREAFNAAFAEHGLDWSWSQEEYRQLLSSSGGAQRIADYAEARGEQVDADAVHATKSRRFQERLAGGAIDARPGVTETVAAARDHGYKVALVTTTSPENVAALSDALRPAVDVGAFDLVVDVTDVDRPKPDGAVYAFALERLGEPASGCVAVEDNVGGVQAATAAGVACVAFPGVNNGDGDFTAAAARVDRLSFDDLAARAG